MQIASNGYVFDVLAQGLQDAPAVLLLHGFPQTSHCWRSVLPHLTRFRVLAPDQRGYSPGARPQDVKSYRMPELVADALGILDGAGIERAHVVGHDWGAAVSWQLAARHPDRVISLTALSVPHPRAFIHALQTDAEQRKHSLYMRDFAQPGYDVTLLADDAAGLRALFGGLPDVDVEDVVDKAREPGALRAWLAWYAAQNVEDIGATPAVKVPTTYVWSDNDIALRRAGAEGTAAWVTGPYRFEVLPGISHWIPEEAGDWLGRLLAETLVD